LDNTQIQSLNARVPAAEEAALACGSLDGRTYSIFYRGALMTRTNARQAILSAEQPTGPHTDDGSKTAIPPSLVPRRFYRILENP